MHRKENHPSNKRVMPRGSVIFPGQRKEQKGDTCTEQNQELGSVEHHVGRRKDKPSEQPGAKQVSEKHRGNSQETTGRRPVHW